MLRASLASLRAHQGRLVLSLVAIVLGVGFAAGSMILTSTARTALYDAFAADSRNVDVVVAPEARQQVPQPLPADVTGRAAQVDGVASATPRMQGYVTLLTRSGRPLGSEGSGLADSVPRDRALRWQHLAAGRLPAGPHDIVLDTGSAHRGGYAVGQRVPVLDARGHTRTYTLTGTVDVAGNPRYASTSYLGLTAGQVVRLTGDHHPARVDVRAASGTDPAALRTAVARALHGTDASVLTGAGYADQQLKSFSGMLLAVTYGLLAFAGIALFVAAIVIANTFSILIAQRSRELALLRCVGASRAQVYRSVLVESAVVGVAGSVLGLLAGLGLAQAAQLVLGAAHAPIPTGPVTPTVAGLVVPFVVGVVVTVVAAAFPAYGATRIRPVAALAGGTATGRVRRAGPVRLVLAALAFAGGCAAMVPGAFGDGGQTEFLLALGGGALAFVGVLLATPVLVPLCVRGIGAVLGRPFGPTGRLATANAVRNPGRAASTCAALLVGVTLISIMSVASASVRATATTGLDDQFPYDLSVTSSTGGAVPGTVVTALQGRRELSGVLPVHHAVGRLPGAGTVDVEGVDPATAGRVLGDVVHADRLRRGDVVLPRDVARPLHAKAGDLVTLRFAGDRILRARVAALSGLSQVVASRSELLTAAPHARLGSVYLKVRAGVPAQDAQEAVDAALAGHPRLRSSGPLEYKASIEQTVDSLLLIFVGLLAVAILIALVGIANTLALSVLERRRESAVLRALGLTRGRLRAMLSGEAVLLAVVAGVLGALLGVLFGWAGVRSLVGADTAVLDVPYAQLAAFAGLAAVAGLIASLLPARRAAKGPVVTALAAE